MNAQPCFVESGTARCSVRISRITAKPPLRSRAWWCMRQMVVFSLSDLLSVVADGTERDAADNLRQWLWALEAAGVLTYLTPYRGPGMWRLARDFGPQAPVWQRRIKRVFDPNSGASYVCAASTTTEE